MFNSYRLIQTAVFLIVYDFREQSFSVSEKAVVTQRGVFYDTLLL